MDIYTAIIRNSSNKFLNTNTHLRHVFKDEYCFIITLCYHPIFYPKEMKGLLYILSFEIHISTHFINFLKPNLLNG